MDPLEDAEVVKQVRKTVGYKIAIRADANRKWSYEKAVQFADSVKNYNLQFLEVTFFSVDYKMKMRTVELIRHCGMVQFKILICL